MSIKDRLAAKSAAIGTHPKPLTKPVESRVPKTAPGQLMSSLPFLAEKEREIQALQEQLLKASDSQIEIPINELIEIDGRRRKLSDAQFHELTENLHHNKLMHPISVRKTARGYEIISGHNRVAAYRALNRRSIPAVVLDVDDIEAEAGALYANLFQSDLSDYEKYLGFKKLITLTGITQKEAAARAGADEKSVSRWMSFDHLPQQAKDMIAAAPNRIGGSAAMVLVGLAREGHIDPVIHAIQAIMSGMLTQEEAVRVAKAESEKKDVPAPTPPSAVTIRSGRKTYCKMTGAKQILKLSFASEEERIEVEAQIQKILEEKAAEKAL